MEAAQAIGRPADEPTTTARRPAAAEPQPGSYEKFLATFGRAVAR